jgi:hypothetical protein
VVYLAKRLNHDEGKPMSRFMVIHHGGTPPSNDEDRDAMMAAWGQWMESAGEALVDRGSPLGPPTSIGGEAADAANGYMILEADDSAKAMELVMNSPLANEDGARVDIHEAVSM